MVFSKLDIKTEVMTSLKFETTSCDFKKVNDNGYSATEIKMSLENYQGLVNGLNC